MWRLARRCQATRSTSGIRKALTGRPFARVDGQDEGARSADGRIAGSYLHGMFAEDGFRRAFLAGFGVQSGSVSYGQVVEETLDGLAAHMGQHLDLDALFAMAR